MFVHEIAIFVDDRMDSTLQKECIACLIPLSNLKQLIFLDFEKDFNPFYLKHHCNPFICLSLAFDQDYRNLFEKLTSEITFDRYFLPIESFSTEQWLHPQCKEQQYKSPLTSFKALFSNIPASFVKYKLPYSCDNQWKYGFIISIDCQCEYECEGTMNHSHIFVAEVLEFQEIKKGKDYFIPLAERRIRSIPIQNLYCFCQIPRKKKILSEIWGDIFCPEEDQIAYSLLSLLSHPLKIVEGTVIGALEREETSKSRSLFCDFPLVGDTLSFSNRYHAEREMFAICQFISESGGGVELLFESKFEG
ncbi:hypothetical protein ADUPG1_012511 [Aduncisulcus paluster]|uniref:Uncharacterized protein n=1 Tax=Aduncisulcus paluster TaxID=2918883 RepID=A0ABQ5K3X3_9EUKA|nr:hypothetical protein ADUPG1_012511 [Aduncisulcus paluster]